MTASICGKKLKSNESHVLYEQSSNQFSLIQNFKAETIVCYTVDTLYSVIISNLVRKAQYKVHSPFLFLQDKNENIFFLRYNLIYSHCKLLRTHSSFLELITI